MIKIKQFGLKWSNNKLTSDKVELPKPGIRRLKDECNVLLSKVKKDTPIYYMYRDVHFKEDENLFKKNNVRYDITVIPPNKFGKEEVKTLGHYHPFIRGKKVSYPEVYEVLHGRGIFLLQKKRYNKVVDVIAFYGKKGDIIIVPPNYGHITINNGNSALIMCNLVSSSFSSVYKDIVKKHGASYYYVVDDEKGKFIKNKNYNNVPYIKERKPKKAFNLKRNIYQDFVENPHKYYFLNYPYKYKKEFEKIIRGKMRVINSRAPERADLAGGTLDIPPVAIPMKGVTLNTAMREYAYCTLKQRKKKGITIESLDFNKKTNFKDWKSIKYNGNLDLLKGAVKVCKLEGNWDIYTSNDSPKQSGRGSSSAILVSLIAAIRQAQGKKFSRKRIAELACKVEIEEMGFRGNGKQDEYGADYPGVKLLRYGGTMDNIEVKVETIDVPDSFVKEVERDMIIGYIGTRKISSDVNLKMVNNFVNGKKKVVNAFKNLKKITLDMAQAMKKGDVDKFVKLLDEETKNRANLADGIVNKKMKKLISIGKRNGVLAAKVMGAGAGGSMLFYCKPEKREQVVRVLEKKGVKVDRFRFDFEGIEVWES